MYPMIKKVLDNSIIYNSFSGSEVGQYILLIFFPGSMRENFGIPFKNRSDRRAQERFDTCMAPNDTNHFKNFGQISLTVVV